MNRRLAIRLCAALTILVLVLPPSAWACSQCCTVCGPLCPQIFYDNYFDEECAWVLAGATRRVNVGGNVMAEFYGRGHIYQEITPHETNDLQFDFDVVNGSAAEGLAVEVVSGSGTVLETLDTVTSSGTYSYHVGDYTSYGTIKIRFRVLMVSETGTAIYRVDNAYFWAY